MLGKGISSRNLDRSRCFMLGKGISSRNSEWPLFFACDFANARIYTYNIIQLPNYCVLYSREKRRQACKQEVLLLKTVVTVKVSRFLPLLSSREIRHQGINKHAREFVSTTTMTWHPQAWSKTMGIASL